MRRLLLHVAGVLVRPALLKFGRCSARKGIQWGSRSFAAVSFNSDLKKIGVGLNLLTRIANSGRFPAGVKELLLKLTEQQELIIKILLSDRRSENL